MGQDFEILLDDERDRRSMYFLFLVYILICYVSLRLATMQLHKNPHVGAPEIPVGRTAKRL